MTAHITDNHRNLIEQRERQRRLAFYVFAYNLADRPPRERYPLDLRGGARDVDAEQALRDAMDDELSGDGALDFIDEAIDHAVKRSVFNVMNLAPGRDGVSAGYWSMIRAGGPFATEGRDPEPSEDQKGRLINFAAMSIMADELAEDGYVDPHLPWADPTE